MKKKVLLIGNNNGLPGVNVDIRNYGDFFKSLNGGAWFDGEINTMTQPSLSVLRSKIALLKLEQLDYLIVVFSGHGGQTRRGTVVELNANGETILEQELQNIAKRQLNIFDCCRAFPQPIDEFRKGGTFSALSASADDMAYIRAKYEKRIMQAVPQQCLLYACGIGETAFDTSEGGVYSKNLLSVGRTNSSEYITVGVAHSEAKALTEKLYPKQHPDAILPRHLTDQSLIFGLSSQTSVRRIY
jgi:hypothetical protein